MFFNYKTFFSGLLLFAGILIISSAEKKEVDRQITSTSVNNVSEIKKNEFLSSEIFTKNKVVLVNFWATWCRPCLNEMASLNRLIDLKGKLGLTVIGVNTDYDNQSSLVKKTEKKYNMKFRTVLDKNGLLVDAFGVTGLPTSFLVKNKKIVRTIKGEFSYDSPKFLSDIDIKLSN